MASPAPSPPPPPPTLTTARLNLSLSHLPPIHVLPARFTDAELHALEAQLQECGASLTYSHHEADLYLADINTARRCELELRRRGFWTEQLQENEEVAKGEGNGGMKGKGKEKEKEKEVEKRAEAPNGENGQDDGDGDGDDACDDAHRRIIKIIKLKWFTQSLAEGLALDTAPFVVYTGRVIPTPAVIAASDGSSAPATPSKDAPKKVTTIATASESKHTLPISKRSPTSATQPTKKPRLDIDITSSSPIPSSPSPSRPSPRVDPKKHAEGILERARRDAQEYGSGRDGKSVGGGGGKWRFRGGGSDSGRHRNRYHRNQGADDITRITYKPSPKLQHVTTKEWEEAQLAQQTREVPEYVKKGLKYACQRPHPLSCPNDHFISLLKTIKLSRTLSLDPIGIRAYSTAIAAIQAYPYPLLSSAEISKLPGCDGKTSSLFHEYIHSTSDPGRPETRTLQVVADLESNPEFQILSLFYGIWGVGAKTAREFYFDQGWQTLDDVVDFGWDKLTRVQQIGLKYYHEFNDIKIPRNEVERIGKIIAETANELRPGYEYIITGGYRRGKPMSGDVDLVLSNRDDKKTQGGFVGLLVEALETKGWVTHTLYLGRGGGFGSQRIGNPSEASTHIGGAGFDNLEKAMVVWQEQELPYNDEWVPGSKEKNPHPHRRVDIILSPPSTVGTAILGWTGGTTYERDMRRYVKATRGWKFDSGGVWDRRTGERIEELGRWEEGEDLVRCERRVIEGLGLPYFEPWERNTG